MIQLFLSRLIFNRHSLTVRRDLADCNQLHRTLLSAFPQSMSDSARAEFGVLYRVETNYQTCKVKLLVQSLASPDWTRLPGGYLAEPEDGSINPSCKNIAPIYESLQQGMRLRFRLRANPTRRISKNNSTQGDKWHGKRIDLRREEDQIDWLRRKAQETGFHLLSLRINESVPNLLANPEGKFLGWRKDKFDKRSKLTFSSVLFEGELLIADVDSFRKALAQGIGSGKAYGFGLLSIAPL
jgi:CRISPR system Cascade subunit CasE